MNTRHIVMALALAAAMTVTGCQTTGINQSGLVDAGLLLTQAATLSDANIQTLGNQTIAHEDRQNRVAPANSKYAKRLAGLTREWRTVSGNRLEYKVYMTPELNAFAVPNGSIRIYSGLMDAMNDDELRYVIAHEIGHVVLGHSKKQMQTAYMASAVRTAAGASGNSAISALSRSQIGALAEKLVNAQYSQKQENEADDFAVGFMRQQGINPESAVTALRKLEARYGNARSVFASHPAPGDRAARLQQKIAAG